MRSPGEAAVVVWSVPNTRCSGGGPHHRSVPRGPAVADPRHAVGVLEGRRLADAVQAHPGWPGSGAGDPAHHPGDLEPDSRGQDVPDPLDHPDVEADRHGDAERCAARAGGEERDQPRRGLHEVGREDWPGGVLQGEGPQADDRGVGTERFTASALSGATMPSLLRYARAASGAYLALALAQALGRDAVAQSPSRVLDEVVLQVTSGQDSSQYFVYHYRVLNSASSRGGGALGSHGPSGPPGKRHAARPPTRSLGPH